MVVQRKKISAKIASVGEDIEEEVGGATETPLSVVSKSGARRDISDPCHIQIFSRRGEGEGSFTMIFLFY